MGKLIAGGQLHPDLVKALHEEQKTLAKMYEPVIDAHHWARENVGNLASHASGEDSPPEFQQNSKRIGQTIFDLFVPDPTSVVDMALTALPAFTKIGALADMASDVTRYAGRMTPAGSGRLRQLMDEVFETFNPKFLEPIKGPKAGPEGWMYFQPEYKPVGKFSKSGDVFTPTGMKQVQPAEIQFDPWELKALLEKDRPEPYADALASLFHELEHHQVEMLPKAISEEIRSPWGGVSGDIPKHLMDDFLEYMNDMPGPKPSWMHPQIWAWHPEEAAVDYGALRGLGYGPDLMRRSIRHPEFLTQNMNLQQPKLQDVLKYGR